VLPDGVIVQPHEGLAAGGRLIHGRGLGAQEFSHRIQRSGSLPLQNRAQPTLHGYSLFIGEPHAAEYCLRLTVAPAATPLVHALLPEVTLDGRLQLTSEQAPRSLQSLGQELLRGGSSVEASCLGVQPHPGSQLAIGACE